MGHIAEALKKARLEREEKLRLGGATRFDEFGRRSIDVDASNVGQAATVAPASRVGLPPESTTRRGVEPMSGAAGLRLADLLSTKNEGLRGVEPVIEESGTEAGRGWDVDSSLVALRDRASSVAEQYRAIRTWLLCRVNPKERTCLGVTSSIPGEGKTVTVANLAVAMAEIRRMQVVAIDCDLREGALADLFRLRTTPGVTDILAGRVGLEDALVKTPISNLSILPAGRLGDANPAELLNSSAAARLFDELRDRFHYSLVDTPPVQRVSDVGVIGALCTGLIMVVRMHKTASHLVRQSITWLQSNNLNVMGCVATGCSLKDAAYSYRGGDYPER